VRSGRQAVEEKRKDEKKRGKTRKKQGLTFGLCSILSANKICRTEEKKVQKTRRKRGDRNRERRKESLFGYQRQESRSSVHQLVSHPWHSEQAGICRQWRTERAGVASGPVKFNSLEQ